MVIYDQAAPWPRQFSWLAQQDTLSCLRGTVALAIGLKTIVGINKHEIAVCELLFDPGEPFQASLSTLGSMVARCDHPRREDGTRQDARVFECLNVPSVGGHDSSESTEQGGVEGSPLTC
jgi:hypothetical protein